MKPAIPIRRDFPAFTNSSSFSETINQHSASLETSQMQQLVAHLLDIEFPLFEETTQAASRFLNVPISFIGIPSTNALVVKAANGLSHLGLMNPLARTRRLPLEDQLTHWVLQERKRLALSNLIEQSPFNQSSLVREYDIQSFLGVPLLTAEGRCVGILAAMDTQPREFSPEAIAFVELLARWSVSEYERQQLVQALQTIPSSGSNQLVEEAEGNLLDIVRLTLMSQLTQDMRNPLTTISGMSNMLSREIYGTLSPKQREYADIVHNSSQRLLEIANEVLELSSLEASVQPLHPTSVDVEMVGHQVQRLLMPLAAKNNQEISVTVEPGSRLWVLDRDVLRQLLYHLVFCIVNVAGEGGTIRIHGSERDNSLNLGVWLAHPWLGEGLPNSIALLHQKLKKPEAERAVLSNLMGQATGQEESIYTVVEDEFERSPELLGLKSREILSLLLGRHLVERHGGTMALQGNAESGYRFLITLPFMKPALTDNSFGK